MGAKKGKVRKYRKPINLNIGMVIFGVIFVYVLVCVILYFQTGHVTRYMVEKGSLATDNVYRGIAIRQEHLIQADTAGYVSYYAREGGRVARNDLVYVVDETGRLRESLEAEGPAENTLSESDLAQFRSEIVNFVHGFDSADYESTYEFKYVLKNTVSKLASAGMLASIDSLKDSSEGGAVDYAYAPEPGIVAYWFDGYESLTPQEVTAACFDEKNYEKTQMLSNTLMAAGDAAYKLSTDENWSVVIPVDAERGEALAQEGYVLVRFLKNQYESWGKTTLLTDQDKNCYLQLDFTNSMLTFLSDRFLDVELIVEDETGLKIPVSAIVEKEFFLIPEDFVTAGAGGAGSLIRQCYLEDGSISSEMLEAELYNYDEENREYYLDSSILNAGDVLYQLDSQNTYTVSRRATLIGVYNMNKGYADFKQINILYQNQEYAIVRSNTRYGLSVYDYIALDASAVKDDQLIKQRGAPE